MHTHTQTCTHARTCTHAHTCAWQARTHAHARMCMHAHGGTPGSGQATHTHAHTRRHALMRTAAHLEADGRGLVAVHGDGREAVQGLEHLAVEGVPGHGGKLLGDRRLGAGADFLTVEPGARRSRPERGLGERRGAQQGTRDASLQRDGVPRAALLAHCPGPASRPDD